MYNIGDKVKIKTNLIPRKWYGAESFRIAMKDWLGKEMTIVKVIDSYRYIMKEDFCQWVWTDKMIEGRIIRIVCDECIHNKICKYAEDYNILQRKVNSLSNTKFKIIIKCEYFKKTRQIYKQFS